MKRLVVILGLLAMVGTLPVSASAAQDRRTGQTSDQNSVELARLKEQLKKLQLELREHEQALREARRAGDRVAAAREASIIRKLKDEIAKIQKKIRELSRGR